MVKVKIKSAKDLFEQAKRFIPGGVNSPVRSFKAVGGIPVFVNKAQGSKIYTKSGREFIDYCLCWGSLICGHAYPLVVNAVKKAIENGTSFGTATQLETELAKLIVDAIPSIEQVRLTNSGTEAVMSAIRLARAYTKKNKIIKFAGSYHGHADYLLVKAGSAATTLAIPNSLGVPKDFTKHTFVVPYNNISEVERIAKKYQDDLAAIIVEPVVANCGVIIPEEGFLQNLRRVCDRYKMLLIFDEVITGFRLAYGGAQEFFDVTSDITCLGKIIGGGLPIGAFGAKKKIMKLLAPLGAVYQAGTLSGNPLAVTAGLTTLRILKQKNMYEEMKKKTEKLCVNIKLKAEEYGIKLQVNYVGSLFSLFFTKTKITDYNSAKRQDLRLFGRFFQELLRQGIYFSPSAFEANFLSLAHSQQDLLKTAKAIERAFCRINFNKAK